MGNLRKKIPITLRHHAHRHAGHRRSPWPCWLLLQGRDSLAGMVGSQRRFPPIVVHRLHYRAHDLVLHVPADLPHLLWQLAHVARDRTPRSRVAQVDDGAADHAGDLLDLRRLSWSRRPALRASSASTGIPIASNISWRRSSTTARRKTAVAEAGAPAEEKTRKVRPVEYLLMALSIAAAGAGWCIAKRAYDKSGQRGAASRLPWPRLPSTAHC